MWRAFVRILTVEAGVSITRTHKVGCARSDEPGESTIRGQADAVCRSGGKKTIVPLGCAVAVHDHCELARCATGRIGTTQRPRFVGCAVVAAAAENRQTLAGGALPDELHSGEECAFLRRRRANPSTKNQPYNDSPHPEW